MTYMVILYADKALEYLSIPRGINISVPTVLLRYARTYPSVFVRSTLYILGTMEYDVWLCSCILILLH